MTHGPNHNGPANREVQLSAVVWLPVQAHRVGESTDFYRIAAFQAHEIGHTI